VHVQAGLLHPLVCQVARRLLAGGHLREDEALRLAALPVEVIPDLLFLANRVRRKNFGDKVEFCSIVNAKSGRCSEDCRFCAQSAKYRTGAPSYPLMPLDDLVDAAGEAAKLGGDAVGLVTSGRGLSDTEFDTVCRAIRVASSRWRVALCASLGSLDASRARRLRDAGVRRYHHNLETSERHFPALCTTHTYADRVRTVRAAAEAGMEVCCGGIFGTGETIRDRIELAFALRELAVDSVPLNFLHPVGGTPLSDLPPLEPMEILRTIALFRIILPDTPIKVAGGREHNLRDLQSWIFHAGATGVLIGDYLTTRGRKPLDDARMVRDLGLVCQSRNATIPSDAP